MDWSDLEEAYKKLNAIWPDRKKHDHLRKGPKSPGFTQKEQREHERVFMNAQLTSIPSNIDWSKIHILMKQNSQTPDEKRAFGSDTHGIPRARYSKEVNSEVMDFFVHLKENWTFVDFQEKHAKLSNDDYVDKLTQAMHWCVRAYKDGEWEIVGNNFIFKNDNDAASFIWSFID